jgi:glycosyltransferase involved in cell wall biosynthesis
LNIGISVTPLYNIKREPQHIDGIGVYTADLYRALLAQGVSIQEVYFKRLSETFTHLPPAADHFHTVPNPLLSFFPGNFYKNITDKIDLLYVTNYLSPRIKGIPTLSIIHDAIMLKYPEWSNSSRSRYQLVKFLLKKMAKQTDHIITCSHASVPDIVNLWGIPEPKISVIYHGIADSWRQLETQAIRQETLAKYQLTKPFFLTVGTVQPRKNLERILSAYFSLPKPIRTEFKLVIVGKDYPNLTPPALAANLSQLTESGQISWLKYVPFDDLRHLYQSAYALLYPSLAEGFGFPVLEGFASATPVITSHFGATAEIAGDAALLVDPYATEAIAAAMLKLIENPELRQQLIQQGLTRSANFTWEKCANETLSVFKKFI